MEQPPSLPPPPNEVGSLDRQSEGAPVSPAISSPPYAGFWIRVAASLIDELLFLPVQIPVTIYFFRRVHEGVNTMVGSSFFGVYRAEFFWWALGLALLRYVYAFVMIGEWNATIGKFAVRIRVRRRDGSRATWREAAIRPALELVLGTFNLSLMTLLDQLWMLWDKRNQTLHDKTASTIVVRYEPVGSSGGDPSSEQGR